MKTSFMREIDGLASSVSGHVLLEEMTAAVFPQPWGKCAVKETGEKKVGCREGEKMKGHHS